MDSDDYLIEYEHPPFDMSNEPACVAKDAEIFSEYTRNREGLYIGSEGARQHGTFHRRYTGIPENIPPFDTAF